MGHFVSEITRAKIGLRLKGKVVSDHQKDLVRKKLMGRKLSPEVVAKIRTALPRGDKHWNWRGGISTIERKMQQNKERRARKFNAKGEHSSSEWEDLKRLYNYMCLCCKKQEPFVKLTEDHIIPLTVGGSNGIENIQPLCQSCNSRKYTTIVDYRLSTPVVGTKLLGSL